MRGLARSYLKRTTANTLWPALSYAGEEGLFYLEGGALGFGFVANPLWSMDDKLGERLIVLLNQDWPKDAVLQISLWASPDLEFHLKSMLESGVEGIEGPLGEFRKDLAEFLRRRAVEFVDAQSSLLVRDFLLLITVRIPLKEALPKAAEMDACGGLRRAVRQNLETVGIKPMDMTAGIYIRIMQTMLNHGDAAWRSFADTKWDDQTIINEQLLDYDRSVQVEANRLVVGEYVVKTIGIKRYPDYGVCGMTRKLLFDPLHGARGIKENCLVTATIIFPDSDLMRQRMETENHFVTQQCHGPILKFAPRLLQKKDSFDTLIEALNDGDRCVRLYLGVVIIAPKEREEAAMSNAKTYLREVGYQAMEDQFITLPAFLTCIPFGADPKTAFDLQRYKTMAVRHAVTQLPIFGPWKGSSTPAMTFISREGQLINLDLFDSKNFGTVISAESGSGKSVMGNEFISSYLSMGCRVWLMDVGYSYKKICDHYGGQYIEFAADSNLCLAPFELIQDWDEEADILGSLVSAMAAPTEGLSDYQTQELQRVMRLVWREHGKDMSVDLLAAALLAETDQRVKDLGVQLYSFTSEGAYGRYFNGKNNVNFNSKFIVLELEGLKSRQHLQRVVLLQLIYQIQQAIYFGELDERKLVIIDEAWDLLKEGGGIDRFIESAYRRFRKYNAAPIVITQSFADLFNYQNGRAIADNSANKVMLHQTAESIKRLQAEGLLDLGDYEFGLLKSVQTLRGKYSEACFITDNGIGVGRLYLSPYKNVLYSTKAEDVAAIRALQRGGMSVDEAVREMVRRKECQ